TNGTLTDAGSPVHAGDFITASDITGLKLVFKPAANAFGTPYGNFTFQVKDIGTTIAGGANVDASPNTFTFNVNPVNDPPTGANNTITTLKEDDTYTFQNADFTFSDATDNPSPNSLAFVRIATLPDSSVGSLKFNGSDVSVGQE